MRQRLLALLLAAPLLALTGPAAAVTIWDLAGDFSAVGGSASGIGPNGAWAYGTDTHPAAGIQFGAFDLVDNAPNWLGVADAGWVYASNGNDSIPGIGLGGPSTPIAGGNGQVILHTRGLNAFPSVIQWTAPAGVTSIDIAASIWQGIYYDPNSNPRPHDIAISLNGVVLVQGPVNHLSNSANPLQLATSQLSVAPGDVIWLLVGPSQNTAGGVHVVDLTITAVPEPTTLALVGLGVTGMGLVRRRSGRPRR